MAKDRSPAGLDITVVGAARLLPITVSMPDPSGLILAFDAFLSAQPQTGLYANVKYIHRESKKGRQYTLVHIFAKY